MKKAVSYFWFMTIQTPNGAGFNISDYQGVLTPEPGETRLSIFNDLREQIVREFPRSSGGSVIAFDLQPNELK